jgi:Carboxypeptidase regulatory-like domain
MMRIWKCLLGGVLLLILNSSMMWAQATAQISGSVRDQTGAVLPGVEVTATQTETGIARMTVTNENGTYVLPNLVTGPYRLEASLPGFRTFIQTGIVLQVNSNPVINAVLEVGQVTEQVEVQANVSQVETRSTAVGQVIENERILELPLNGREVTDLIVLSGAAVQTAKADTTSWQGGRAISVAGGLDFGVSYSLDGALHNNVYDGTQMPMPFPDALQEFKVEASGRSAAGGTRGSGGQVNAVTRSGTNDFHGDAFWFVRNYKFNARNFFAAERDNLKRNQYGATLGGPVAKNKLFFFGGYQGTNTRSASATLFQFVPTRAMLAGDFRDFASAACNSGRAVTLRDPFVNNQINPALFSRPALNMAATFPAAVDPCGRSNYGATQKLDERQFVTKVDYQASDKHSLFGRYLGATFDLPAPYELSKNVLSTADVTGLSGQGFDNFAQSYAVGSTYLLGPTAVNAFRMSVNRTRILRAGAHFWSAPSMGVKGYSEVDDHALLQVTGGASLSLGARADSNFTTTAYQLGDDLSFLKGNHQMVVGANIAHWRTLQRAHTQDVGRYRFDGGFTGLGMADFLLGRLKGLDQQQPVQWSSRQTYLAAYLADTWQAKPRLSLTYGVRYEPFITLRITEGAVYHFDVERFRRGIRSTVYPNAVPTVPAGLYYPGDPGFPPGTQPVFNRLGLFAPRVGLAWDVQGDGRTSVRASYGLAYDFSGSISFGGSSSAPPWGFDTTLESPAGGLEDPWRDYPGGIPFPLDRSIPRFKEGATYYYTATQHAMPPSVQNWNLSIQQQLPASFVISTTYIGSNATHLWTREAVNDGVFVPGNGDANGRCFLNGQAVPFRVNAGAACSTNNNLQDRRSMSLIDPVEGRFYNRLSARTDGGTRQYHGLLTSVQRQAARGINVGMNYTWSHCIGDDPTGNDTGVGGTGFLVPGDRRRDRASCNGDRRHLFNATAVLSTPQFANPTMRAVASGWRVSGIYRRTSGQYLTVLTGRDLLLTGQAGNQRVNQLLEDPYGDRNSLDNFLNANAFAQPATGAPGNIGRNTVEGPRTWQFDMALSRAFQVKESQRVELRIEAFNVTNSLIRQNPNTSFASNLFGRITSAEDPRIMQFALKYSF